MTRPTNSKAPRNEADLEELLSRPTEPLERVLKDLPGDILVLGVSGKMGPTLARMAKRASDAAKTSRRIVGVARFTDTAARKALEQHGVETIACDMRDRAAVARLPDAPNVVYMVGQKFGTQSDPQTTWSINVDAAALAGERYKASRIVVFSTGNVYPLSPIARPPIETDPTGPVGDYAESALGRERAFTEASQRNETRIAILRLNYAVEPRYGVLRDLTDKIIGGKAVDVTMGYVNVIWQRDANAIALRALAHAATPPFILNVTGPGTLGVRDLAHRIGERLGLEPRCTGAEAPTALLSDASKMADIFGQPEVSLDRAIAHVADWVKRGGGSLNKPTHFEERGGSF